jgi:hypothetical protein
MLRKTMMALMATIAVGALAPESALARGGFGGGHGGFSGFHGGGGGWHGGGVAAFRGAPIGGGGVAFRQAGVVGGPRFVGGVHPGFHPGFRRRAFIAGAIAGAAYAPYGYGYYDGYDPYYAYPDQVYSNQLYPNQVYYDGGYVEPSCTVTRERVLTRYGWRYRTVQVCE